MTESRQRGGPAPVRRGRARMAFVAAGRLDGYWERDLQAWDIAAGKILVREAGGIVSGIPARRPA